jgi:hypothetical protein
MANNMFEKIKGMKKTSASGVASVAAVRKKHGKSSDPNYSQTSVYLKTETIKKAQVKLIEKEFDFSDLVEKLVQDWLVAN